MLIFHQIFFSFEIIAIVNHNFKLLYISFLVSMILGLYIILEGYFMKFIIRVFQEIVEIEEANAVPRAAAWRIPSVSELLGDECEIGQSSPPTLSTRNSNEREQNFSEA
jgi:hypothetical protein